MDVVYLITDTITNLKYIGSKKNWKGVGTYFGSPNCRSPRFKKYKIQQEWKAALKTRKDTFVFEILEQYESIEHTKLTERELFWQKKLDVVKSTEYINAGFAKHGFHGNIYEQLSNEEATLIKEKISLSMKLRIEIEELMRLIVSLLNMVTVEEYMSEDKLVALQRMVKMRLTKT